MISKNISVVSFGEVLFDVFPEKRCLGGAPLNLAVHLHRLGAQSTLISAIGDDEAGRMARETIRQQGLDDGAISTVPQATGEVCVRLDEKKVPSYEFRADCAYDHIPLPPPGKLPEKAELFCFGTLAQRGEESRENLKKLLQKDWKKVFCDVNLRQNFYSREILEFSLSRTDWVKLNDEELPVLAKIFHIPPLCGELAKKFQLETIIETLGPDGCTVWHNGSSITIPAEEATVVSTVGAGDAFSAAFLYARLTGKSILESAEAGNSLAAKVAGQPGAF